MNDDQITETLAQLRKRAGKQQDGVSTNDFYAYMPMHNYIYARSREPWPASSVNARIPPVPLVDNSGRPILKKVSRNISPHQRGSISTNRSSR